MQYNKNKFRVLLAGFVYLGCVAGNAAFHYVEARVAVNKSQKADYSLVLRQKWRNYARYHLERMTSPLMLVPLSSFFENHEIPQRIGPETKSIDSIIDVEE